jgi:hypothetical protein
VRDLRGREGEPLDQDPSTPASDPFLSSFRTIAEPPEPVGPHVVWVRPQDGEGNAAAFRPILVRFSRPVQLSSVAGHDALTLRQIPGDAIVSGDPVGDAERRTFTIAPRVTYNGGLLKPGFRYRVVVTSGVLDDAGISFDQDSTARGRQPFSASLRAELCPRIRASSPAAGARRVPLLSDIRLSFTQPVSLGSVTQSSLILSTGGVPVVRRTVTVSADSTTLILTPEEPLIYFRQYTVEADSTLLSTRGSRLDQDSLTAGYQPFNLRFTTTYESLPPQVIDSNPQDGQTGVALNTGIMVHFDHTVATRSVRCSVPDSVSLPVTYYLEKLAPGDTSVVAVQCSTAPDSLYAYLTPEQALQPGTSYRVTVSNWVTDQFDTRLDQNRQTWDVREPFVCVFTTVPQRRKLTP